MLHPTHIRRLAVGKMGEVSWPRLLHSASDAQPLAVLVKALLVGTSVLRGILLI